MFLFTIDIFPVPLSGDTGSVNPSARLAEIRGKIAVAERTVREVEQELTEAILDTEDNDDSNILRQRLYQARAYEGELRTAEQAWDSIVSENKKAEDKTKEQFKPGG